MTAETSSGAAIPTLLPSGSIPKASGGEWKPKSYLNAPQPPPSEEGKVQDELLANARAMLDGTRLLKKTRPRRTVDYFGGMGRWALTRKLRPNPDYVPWLRPSPPNIIDLLPPKAYMDNASTSLCTKYVHTSTNKIRCPVNVVAWTPEGRRVLTGSTSGEFTLWNGLTFNFETILQAHDSAICAMTFTHSGAYIASADKTGVIKYFEPNMNNLTAWQGSSSKEAIRGISFSPDDTRFATASDDSSVRIWDFQESRVESALTGHGWDVKCVQWHPTKGLLVSGSKDNQIKFWDPRTGTVLTTLHQHKNTVQALSWSPNGNMVASASRDQTVRVFDIRALKELRLLKGHKKEVCSVTWHPVQPIVVSGGAEGSILHWDMSSSPEDIVPTTLPPPGRPGPGGAASVEALLASVQPTPASPPRATLSQAHDSNVWSLAFHPLGHLLVSGSNDHTTRFWSRERPGDATSVFSGGGEKPVVTAEDEDDMDDDEFALPGFVAAAAAAANGLGEDGDPATDFIAQQGAAMAAAMNQIPGGGGYGSFGGGMGPSSSMASFPGAPGRGGGGEEDFIPGFGGPSDSGTAGRDPYMGGGGFGGGGGDGFGGGGGDFGGAGAGREFGRFNDRERDYDNRGGGGRDRFNNDRGRDRFGRDGDWSRDRGRDRSRDRDRDRDWDDRNRDRDGRGRGRGRQRGRY